MLERQGMDAICCHSSAETALIALMVRSETCASIQAPLSNQGEIIVPLHTKLLDNDANFAPHSLSCCV